MKKLMTILLCWVLLFSVAGCSTTDPTAPSYYESVTYVVEPIKTENQTNASVSQTSSTNKKKTIVKYVPKEPTKTKSIEFGSESYTAKYRDIDTLYNSKREFYLYYDELQNYYFYYDKKTLELTKAYIYRNDEEIDTKNKITKSKAEKMGKAFIKKYCNNLSDYVYDGVRKSSEGYEIEYSRYIDGYISTQGVTCTITIDGKLKSYYHRKYIYDGINTDVEIDGEALYYKLIKTIKENYGKTIPYKITSHNLCPYNDKLCMRYSVKIAKHTQGDKIYCYRYHDFYFSVEKLEFEGDTATEHMK